MTVTRKMLCVVYALIGLVALVGTWGNNVDYLHLGFVGATVNFWQETLANPASRSITVDILFLSLAAIIWLLLEARRLSMRGAWLYIIAGTFVAISAAFPAFLIHRERVLAARDTSSSSGTLTALDIIGLSILSMAMLAYTFLSLVA
jgi:hypothetical protein